MLYGEVSDMSLTELQCRQAKGREKIYTLSDGGGLILEVRPSGKKYWISRIWRKGKEKRKCIGNHPDLSVKQARLKNIEVRNGVDPLSGDLFGTVAEEWLKVRAHGRLSEGYIRTINLRMKKYILPAFEKTPISEITAGDVLSLCRTIEASGFVETSHRIKNLIGQVCRFAISTGRIDNDPTSALQGALKISPDTHYATITDKEGIRALLQACNVYRGVVVRHALLFSIYTFCRPGEIRSAEWSEIDWEKCEWKIPAEKMKMKRPHLVPLCTQCLELLESLKQITGYQKWLFPSACSDKRCMSDNTVRIALRTLGYQKEDITPHGFRAMASTILNENGFQTDIIERQLAHVQGNAVRAAYNHAQYLDQRQEMMQWWGDWLEGSL